MRETLSSIIFPPPSPSSSNGEPKRLEESNVMVVNGRRLKDASSSTSVVRNLERALGSSRDCRWKRLLGDDNIGRLGPLQDVIQDELGAFDGPRLGGLDIPRRGG